MTRNLVETVEIILIRAAAVVENHRDEIEIPALKEMEGSMKQRIHNKGQDSSGDRIGSKTERQGKYTKGYERRKTNGGLIGGRTYAGSGGNIYPINLQVHGDLLKDFTVGTKENLNVLEFQTDLSRKKAERHEKSYKTDIYRPSDNELEGFKDVLLIGIDEVIRKNFKL